MAETTLQILVEGEQAKKELRELQRLIQQTAKGLQAGGMGVRQSISRATAIHGQQVQTALGRGKAGEYFGREGRQLQKGDVVGFSQKQGGLATSGLGGQDIARMAGQPLQDEHTAQLKRQADATKEAAEKIKQAAREAAKEERELAKVQREVTAAMEKRRAVLAKLNTAVGRQKENARMMIQMHKELGVNSKTTTVGLLKQARALELLEEKTLRMAAKGKIAQHEADKITASLQRQRQALLQIRPEVDKYNQGMQFMGGASVFAQKAVRQSGAAAQGAMLGMSALNGDVMGLAFSLIFLQFAANLPVALGFAAITIGAMAAIKVFSKWRKEQKYNKQMARSFYAITGSVESMNIANQKSAAIAKELVLGSGDEKEAIKALTQAQLQLRTKGVDPTAEHMKIATHAFILAKNEGLEYEEALQEVLSTVMKFNDTGIATFRGDDMTLEEMARRATNALDNVSTHMLDGNATMDEWIATAKSMGIEGMGLETLEDYYSQEGRGEFLARTESDFGKYGSIIRNIQDKMVEFGDTSSDSATKLSKAFATVEKDVETHLGKDSTTYKNMDALIEKWKEMNQQLALKESFYSTEEMGGGVEDLSAAGIASSTNTTVVYNIDVHDNSVDRPDELAAEILHQVSANGQGYPTFVYA